MPEDVTKEILASAPVTYIEKDKVDQPPEPGVGLCLSGGGYRAMLFHVGAVIRLNEAALLPKLTRVSSVSGGSIAAGVLGLHWRNLQFDARGFAANLDREFVAPVREMASHTIDVTSIFGGIFLPGSPAEKVAKAYDKHLFHGATLQDLPAEPPCFVINSTNVQSGALWRFSRDKMADYKVGTIDNPTLPLATAVAASSAFPPVLSPLVLHLDPALFVVNPLDPCPLAKPPYTTKVFLTDGGVYDKLGLETVWKKYDTVLVSDGGAKMKPEEEPHKDLLRHTKRVFDLVDNQVRSLRKRQLVDSYERKAGPLRRKGAYWGINTEIAGYGLSDALPCDPLRTKALADIDTRLASLEPTLQERLINWGYAVCDAAIRRFYVPGAAPPAAYPYPTSRV